MMSSRRVPLSTSLINDCGRPIAFEHSTCVNPALVRRSRKRVKKISYSERYIAFGMGAVQYEQPRNLYLIFGYLNFRYPVDARHGSPVGRLLTKGMDMKLYLSMFLAVICMPIASLAGIFAMELGYVLSFRQAIGVGVLVGTVILILAVIFFLLSIPSTMQRLRTSNCTGNKSQG